MSVAELEAIEEIKKLKARYFRLQDQRLWDQWADLFVEDATVECILAGENNAIFWQGRDQIVAENRAINTNQRGIHHGHTPDIEITSETTATGSWALFDLYFLPHRAEAYGYYEDHYVKKDGRWKIKSIKLVLERAPNS